MKFLRFILIMATLLTAGSVRAVGFSSPVVYLEGESAVKLEIEANLPMKTSAVQFTVSLPESVELASETLILNNSNLQSRVHKENDNTYNYVIYTADNSAISYYFYLSLKAKNGSIPGSYAVHFSNIIAAAPSGHETSIPDYNAEIFISPKLNYERVTLKSGESVSLTDNNVWPQVTWTSSDETVATVDANGTVTAVSPGYATITARYGDSYQCCYVKVVSATIPAESIELSQRAAELKAGDTVTLSATVLPEDATDKTVTWSSSDEAIATVDANGKVTAIAVGEAVITARCGEVSASCTVTVTVSIEINPRTVSLMVGEKVRLTATVLPENAPDKTITWESMNEYVATIDEEGTVTAIGKGSAVVGARCGNVSAICSVKVSPAIEAESIELSQTAVTLKVGETVTLTATVLPEDTTDKTVTWGTSNDRVVTVDGNGKVTAVGLGKTTVYVGCGNIMVHCAVTVEPTPAESVELSQSAAELKAGETVTLSATVLPETATDKKVTWSSSDEAIATVDAKGKVTAVAVGKAVITASCGAVSANCTVTVVPTPAESITLSQLTAQLKVGEEFTLFAMVLPVAATDKTVTWSSSDEAIATVDSKGKVTAVAVGKAVITASCGAVSATCEVTVLPVMVESITLTPDVWSGMAGDYIQLVAVVMPEDATDKSLSWTSSDEAVATVDDSGKVSIQSDGSCVITATANDGSGVEARCIITGLSGIDAIFSDGNTTADVYSLGGFLLKKNCDRAGLRQLAPGAYIVKQGQTIAKMIVR
ncbi:MAG: Ig-like domain-containing protein [Muribaculaceae bacterium]|nr:Ig-like domain-containing protein [Muribaculaceae bacterium]